MSSKGKVASVRVKDVNVFELTPGLADALTASMDASYRVQMISLTAPQDPALRNADRTL